MDGTDQLMENGKRSGRLPYEKPTATRVDLRPEELLTVCSKTEKRTDCGGTPSGRKAGKKMTVVAPRQS